MKNKGLTSKEKEFCRLYVRGADAAEAAKGAGYTKDSLKTGNKLLGRAEIAEEIARLCKLQKKSLSKMATVGFQRLAFGSIADAVSLLYMENPSPEVLRKMDLFSVSQIKRPKDGSMEIKFFDRMEALEKLSEDEEKGDGAALFYEAIRNSALKLGLQEQQDNGD